jgi:hypothetical protein
MPVSRITGAGDLSGIYEPWLVKGGKKPVPVDENGHVIGSPLLKAVDDAFKSYINVMETSFAMELSGVVSYALQGNNFHVLTAKDIAPFLALNVMG